MKLLPSPEKNCYVGNLRGFNEGMSPVSEGWTFDTIATSFLGAMFRTVALEELLRKNLNGLIKDDQKFLNMFAGWGSPNVHNDYAFSSLHYPFYLIQSTAAPGREMDALGRSSMFSPQTWGRDSAFADLNAIHPVFRNENFQTIFMNYQLPVMGAWCLEYAYLAPLDSRSDMEKLRCRIKESRQAATTVAFLQNLRNKEGFVPNEMFRNLAFSVVPFELKKKLIEKNWDIQALLNDKAEMVKVPPSLNDSISEVEPFLQQLLLDKKCLIPDDFFTSGHAKGMGLTVEKFALMVMTCAFISKAVESSRPGAAYWKHFHQAFGHLRFSKKNCGPLLLLVYFLQRLFAIQYANHYSIYQNLFTARDLNPKNSVSEDKLQIDRDNFSQFFRTAYDRNVFFLDYDADKQEYFLNRIELFPLEDLRTETGDNPSRQRTVEFLRAGRRVPTFKFTATKEELASYLT